MKSEDPLIVAWNDTLGRKATAPAIFDARGEVIRTFREIEERASAIESTLGGNDSDNIHPIQLGNHPDWPSSLLAGLRKRRVVVPLDQSLSARERDAALALCRKSAKTDWQGNPPALFKLTSGTTAARRVIRFRSEQLLADCNQICETMGITENDRNFAVIPVSHSYGFSNLITPLIARGIPMVLSSDPMPRAILNDLAASSATVFPGMPVFYQAFSELEQIPELNRLRLCISAGAPLSHAIAQKFRGRFQRPVYSFYGSSECGGICYDRKGIATEDGFVGEPMEGVTLELLDPDAESGRVRVRSNAVGDGYFPEPNEEKLGNGFFVPDDLLRQSDGCFRIVGRISDLINVAGKKLNPAEVEAELLRYNGVKEAIVFGRESTLRHQEVAACVVAKSDVSEMQLLEFCRQRLSAWQVPKQILFVADIPVNERGKISRRDLARNFPAQKS